MHFFYKLTSINIKEWAKKIYKLSSESEDTMVFLMHLNNKEIRHRILVSVFRLLIWIWSIINRRYITFLCLLHHYLSSFLFAVILYVRW